MFDIGKAGFVEFGPDGAARPTTPHGVPVFGGSVARTALGLLVESQASRSEADGNRERLMAFGEGDTTELAFLDTPRWPMVQFDGCPVRMAVGPLFAVSLTWAARDSVVAVNAEPDFVIRVFRGTRLVTSIRRDVAPRPVTADLARAEVGEGMRIGFNGRSCTIDPAEVVEKRGHASVIPAVRRLAVAPRGNIWVQRGHVRGEQPPIDLFASGGAYLGSLPPGAPFPDAFTPDGDVVTIERDELDVERVVVYGIDREGS